MTTQETADSVVAWAIGLIPALNGWPRNPEDLDAALPIVTVDASRKRKVRSDTGSFDTAIQGYEQTWLIVREFEVTLFVKPDPEDEAAQTLNSYVDQLTEDLGIDPTLGQRVRYTSPYYDASWQGEVEHPSGTVARAAVISVTIGEEE